MDRKELIKNREKIDKLINQIEKLNPQKIFLAKAAEELVHNGTVKEDTWYTHQFTFRVEGDNVYIDGEQILPLK